MDRALVAGCMDAKLTVGNKLHILNSFKSIQANTLARSEWISPFFIVRNIMYILRAPDGAISL